MRFSRRRLLAGAAAWASTALRPRAGWTEAARWPRSREVSYWTREDSAYAILRQPFNKRIRLEPPVIAQCLSERGVQEAVREASRRGLPVALKSGGHSFEGFCLNADGMVLELSALAGPELTEDVLHTGPGTRLGALHEVLLEEGRLIPAGTCAGVGIGGLTLGGGYGFFSRAHGLTCDSLRRVRVVDGKGEVHDSDHDAELLWACRGGGTGGLGVVTALEFDTFAAPARLASWRFRYAIPTTKQALPVLERWFSLAADLPRTSFSACVLGHGRITVLIVDCPGERSTPRQRVLDSLEDDADGPPATRSEPLEIGLKHYRASLVPENFKNVSAGYYSGWSDLRDALPDVHARMKTCPGMLLQINTLGGAICDPAREPTAAYPHRRFGFLGELQVYWQDPRRERPSVEAVQAIQRLFASHGIRAHYANYPDTDLTDSQLAYYGASYPRLQTVKRRLDPADLFRHPQSIRG